MTIPRWKLVRRAAFFYAINHHRTREEAAEHLKLSMEDFQKVEEYFRPQLNRNHRALGGWHPIL